MHICFQTQKKKSQLLKVKPMRVGESAVNFECKLVKTHDVVNAAGKVTATVLFGEVCVCARERAEETHAPRKKERECSALAIIFLHNIFFFLLFLAFPIPPNIYMSV